MHSIFQESSARLLIHLATGKLPFEALANKHRLIGIKRFAWFYERYNCKVLESNVAIKGVGFTQN